MVSVQLQHNLFQIRTIILGITISNDDGFAFRLLWIISSIQVKAAAVPMHKSIANAIDL
jgi:hypothetical protein